LDRPSSIASSWPQRLFESNASFEELAITAFQYQAVANPVYTAYIKALGINPDTIHSIEKIPFLPIRFFKTHTVQSDSFEPAIVFESSTTTGQTPSHHFVKNISLYQASYNRGFRQFFGDPSQWCILGLLPSYLERQHSSLVYMMDDLIKKTGHPKSGFYLHDLDALHETLQALEKNKQPTLLLGVTFALLDFAAAHPMPLHYTTIIETGGMKGRGIELTREEVHAQLKKAFRLDSIGAEYGMTELLSQAWSMKEGRFTCPPWMKVLIREEEDPLQVKLTGTGALNIIDLANIDSCCFIGTDDAGRVYADGHFEMLGRLDGSDIRGCSLLTA
jgi:phenylacetate-coenzyme A ligase PaaK-like adenylate-forming protein